MSHPILYIIVDGNYNVIDKIKYRSQHGLSVFKSYQQAKVAYHLCKTKMACWLIGVPLRDTHSYILPIDTIKGMQ